MFGVFGGLKGLQGVRQASGVENMGSGRVGLSWLRLRGCILLRSRIVQGAFFLGG